MFACRETLGQKSLSIAQICIRSTSVGEAPPRSSCPDSEPLSCGDADTAGLEAVDLYKVIRKCPLMGPEAEKAYLDGLLVKSEAGLRVDEEVPDLDTMIALELDHLAHTLGLDVANDGAIASWAVVSIL